MDSPPSKPPSQGLQPWIGSFVERWQTSPSAGFQLSFLDGLRGLAVLLVVCCHAIYFNPEGSAPQRLIGQVALSGAIGVNIFCVISGLVISYPFFRRKLDQTRGWYPAGYARRRFWKIVPPYYLSLLLLCLFFRAAYGHAMVNDALAWAVGLPAFVQMEERFNPVAWTLLIEAEFYLVLPLLFFLTKPLNLRWTTAVLTLVLFLVPLAVRQLTWSDLASPQGIAFTTRRFPAHLDRFAWGVLFAGWLTGLNHPHGKRPVRLAGLGTLGLLGIAATMVLFGTLNFLGLPTRPTRWSIELIWQLPAAATFLVLFFALDETRLGASWLRHPAMRWIGLVSYEWYLFHQPLIMWFRHAMGSAEGSLARYVCVSFLPALLSLLFAAGIYRWFSLPILRRGRAPARRW